MAAEEPKTNWNWNNPRIYRSNAERKRTKTRENARKRNSNALKRSVTKNRRV